MFLFSAARDKISKSKCNDVSVIPTEFLACLMKETKKLEVVREKNQDKNVSSIIILAIFGPTPLFFLHFVLKGKRSRGEKGAVGRFLQS